MIQTLVIKKRSFMTAIKIRKTYDNMKLIFLIVEKILVFASITNLVREVKNKSPNFKKIADDILSYLMFSLRYVDPFYH